MSEQSAKAKCLRADRLLQRARAANSDKNLIMEAMQLYQEALAETGAQLAEPYLGLAYIAYSAGQKADALALLYQAQTLEPTNLRVQTLLLRMEKATPVATASATPALQPIRSLRQQLEKKTDNTLEWEFTLADFAFDREDNSNGPEDEDPEDDF